MSQQEQKEFQEYLKTLCPWDREWALDMASRGIPTARIFMRKADEVHGRTAHPSSNGCYIRYPDSQLRNGNLAAHRVVRLVLLGSPPDTIHRALLRKTRSSTPLIRVRRHSIHPRSGIPPRCSGLRVTGHRYLPK